MPEKQRSEDFSRAYIEAIAAHAGVNIHEPRRDFGIDLAFSRIDRSERVSKKGSKLRYTDTHSVSLPCQVKSSKDWTLHNNAVLYDLEVKNYNDLVNSSACFLILMCLPPTIDEWLSQDENGLRLMKCCYYWRPSENEDETDNDRTKQICIPRSQVFTAEALIELLNERQGGVQL